MRKNRKIENYMLITKHSILTDAQPSKIWKFWSDVKTWHTWDDGLDGADIDGEFVKGSSGWLKPADGPKVKLELMEVRVNEFFHDITKLPLGRIDFYHTLERVGEQTKITQQIEMHGLLTFVFSRLIGKGLRERLPSVMNTLARQAEKA